MTRRELIALVLAFAVTLPAVTTRLYASDEVEYFAWLRSVVFDRDVDFDNEYRYFFDRGVARSQEFYDTFLVRVNETGKRINYAPVGTAVLWAPFYALGHLAALATGAPADGLSQPYIAAVTYGSACYAFLAVLLSALIARRLAGRGLAASLAIAFGTPLLFYACIAPGFSHAASAFAVSLFIWIWLRVRDRWSARDALHLGLAGGMMAMVREQDAFLALGPALDFLWHHRPRASGSGGLGAVSIDLPIAQALVGVGAFLLAFSPQLLGYYALNGHPGPTETLARKMNWLSPHALGVLFSPLHGFFAWTPLAAAALTGLVVGLGRRSSEHPRVFALLLVMVATQVYASGAVESWTVAGAFGQRRFLALTPILTVGLAVLFTRAATPWTRRGLVALIGLCIWWNVGLMAQFGLHRMDRQRLTLVENARTTFIDLPMEAPGIAWRYLTDRQSFYRQPRQ